MVFSIISIVDARKVPGMKAKENIKNHQGEPAVGVCAITRFTERHVNVEPGAGANISFRYASKV